MARTAHPELGDVRAAKSSDRADATAIRHKTEGGRLQSGSSRGKRFRPSCHYHSWTNAPVPPSAHTDALPSGWLLEGSKPTHLVHRQVNLAHWCKLRRAFSRQHSTQGWPWKAEMERKALKSQRLGQAPSDSPAKREKWPTGQGTHRPWTGGNSLAGRERD